MLILSPGVFTHAVPSAWEALPQQTQLGCVCLQETCPHSLRRGGRGGGVQLMSSHGNHHSLQGPHLSHCFFGFCFWFLFPQLPSVRLFHTHKTFRFFCHIPHSMMGSPELLNNSSNLHILRFTPCARKFYLMHLPLQYHTESFHCPKNRPCSSIQHSLPQPDHTVLTACLLD